MITRDDVQSWLDRLDGGSLQVTEIDPNIWVARDADGAEFVVHYAPPVVLLRVRDDGADYLALADAVLVLDTADGLQVISDERVNQLAGKERAAANRVPAGSALKLRRRAPAHPGAAAGT